MKLTVLLREMDGAPVADGTPIVFGRTYLVGNGPRRIFVRFTEPNPEEYLRHLRGVEAMARATARAASAAIEAAP